MVEIVKPRIIIDPETVRVNQENLQAWGKQSIEENSRPVALVSVNNDNKVFLKIPNYMTDKREAVLHILEFACNQLRDQIRRSKV